MLSGVQRLSDRSTFSFSSRTASRVGSDRRLHGQRAQQLQRMVLHHVAQGAGLVVEGAALFHAQVLGDRDLDVGDVLAPPDGLEQRVAEAQRNRFCTEGLPR
jgi:hypothetical protein